ncbi:MAG: FkbM family methyltransferase [Anaerolineae bacterium]|nr:FkbM family methyltransferase [Anaerolineae bacterium]
MRKYWYYLTSIARILAGIDERLLVVRMFLGLAGPGVYRIRLRESGIQFLVRGAMDVWIVKETCLDRFYERHGGAVGTGWTVVDVGAGLGDFSLCAALRHPSNRVYAFEPFPGSFELLVENLRLNGVANVHPFAEAIGAESGEVLLDLSTGEPLQMSTETAAGKEGALTVPARSLADVFLRLNIERCDLLKLDCEGAEYAILFHAPQEVLGRVSHIVMEYHDQDGGYTRHDLVEFLVRQGFAVTTHPNPVHPHLGFLYAQNQKFNDAY